MGWLGWSERDALATDVNSILIAMEGKLEMMYPGVVERKPLTKDQFNASFKSFVAQHNARIKNK